jgi:predicted RNA methylase
MKKSDNNLISRSEAAEILCVSVATVKNWEKSGILKADKEYLNRLEVIKIVSMIESGELQKLGKRANKKKCHLAGLSKKEADKKNFIQFSDDLYQFSKPASVKSAEGSFYTPQYIVDDIIADHQLPDGASVYDPCCGTGRFLKSAFLSGRGEVKLTGTDKDSTALDIANSVLNSLGSSNHKLLMSDSLMMKEQDEFDFIFTNPPWGAYLKKDELKELQKKYHEARTDDSFGFFILHGLRSLKKSGIMSFVLPESFLYSSRFTELRKHILKNTSIIKLKSYGRAFKGVFSDIVRIDLRKITSTNNSINIESEGNSFSVDQRCFSEEFGCRFNIGSTDKDRSIINKMYSQPYTTLKNNSEWSLGIVTGNNKKFISDRRDNCHKEIILTGKNIYPFLIKGGFKYISDDFSSFQQVPSTNLFVEKEKLIYRFISDSLVFSLDKTCCFTLNSANILIPKLPGYTISTVMAILNSKLMNCLYRKKFKSLKVLRSYLEELPFPENPDEEIINLIDEKTNRIINTGEVSKKTVSEIENIIEKLYGVNL